VFPNEAIWGFAVDRLRRLGEYAQSKDLEVVIEHEPFTQALVKDVDELVRFVREVDHPAVRANADISHLHLSRASFHDVKKPQGIIGHIHLSDCDAENTGICPQGGA
jgi:D-psicose/D-tagatose/L-ribulose 3-epimerase